jgi:hypothetical protein
MGLAIEKGALDWLLLWWVTLRHAFEISEWAGSDNELVFHEGATGCCFGLGAELPLWLHRLPIDTFLEIRRWELGTGPMSGTRKDHARGNRNSVWSFNLLGFLLSLI